MELPSLGLSLLQSFVGISTDGGELISSEYVQLTLSYMTADGRSALYKGADALPIASLGKICHETLHVCWLEGSVPFRFIE